MTIYRVTLTPPTDTTKLIDAKTKAGAIAHFIRNAVVADVPTPQEMLALGKAGAEIEEAGETVDPAAKIAAQ